MAESVPNAVPGEVTANITNWVEISPGIARSAEPVVVGDGDVTSEHQMGLVVDSGRLATGGLIRVVTERTGRVDVSGYVDRSHLSQADPVTHEGHWRVGQRINISNLDQWVTALQPPGTEFVGLEDPDIMVDKEGNIHVYCTGPFIPSGPEATDSYLYLFHASGPSLGELTLAEPVLSPVQIQMPDGNSRIRSFKEFCPAPPNSDGISLHLVESNDYRDGVYYSTVAVAEATSFDGPWKPRGDVIHPAEVAKTYAEFATEQDDYNWCAGHASPCRLLPDGFVNVNPKYKVGILNGRSPDQGDHYGRFLPGPFLYDPETGEVPWVSPRPLVDDALADTIIFGSEFIPPNPGETAGTLMAHVDDAKVYAYSIEPDAIASRIPPEFMATTAGV